jgi:hypothetical protein
VLHKTLIALAAAAALGCVPVATNALAASHPDNHANARHAATGHATDRHAMTGHARTGHVARCGIGYRQSTMDRSTMDRSMTAVPATARVMATVTVDAQATVVLSAG